jgi:hypothetical protein
MNKTRASEPNPSAGKARICGPILPFLELLVSRTTNCFPIPSQSAILLLAEHGVRARPLFSSLPNSKFFTLSITLIFERMHGTLNVGKINN